MSATDWSSINLLWDVGNGTSYNHLARKLLIAVAGFSAHKGGSSLWRGHCSIDYKISPSMFRETPSLPTTREEVSSEAEATLRIAMEAARSWRQGLTFKGLTDLERLAHLQHHGTPTPLLDVTPDPMIALWMAAQAHDDGVAKDGLLIGFNVTGHWREVSEERASYAVLLENLEKNRKIGLLRPPVSDDRIVVQRSRLLVTFPYKSARAWWRNVSDVWLPPLASEHRKATGKAASDKLKNLVEGASGRPAQVPMLAFRVPAAIKETILSVLRDNYGIERHTIFPDPSGLSIRYRPGSS